MTVDEVVEQNMGLVCNMAKKYARNQFEFDDCVQDGVMGMIEAWNRFDPATGNRFSTYAHYWIWQRISRGRRAVDPDSPIRYPEHKYNEKDFVKAGLVSFQTESEFGLTLAETIGECDNSSEAKILIDCGFQVLSPREIEVLQRIFFLGEELQHIGKILGISKQRVWQIQSSAMKKMKKQILGGNNGKGNFSKK